VDGREENFSFLSLLEETFSESLKWCCGITKSEKEGIDGITEVIGYAGKSDGGLVEVE
jgi:hypothetical protein